MPELLNVNKAGQDSDVPFKDIGDRLYEVRTKLRLNKKDFAASIGKSPTSYGRYEDGIRADLETIRNICAIHGVSADWLVNGLGQMFRQEPGGEELAHAEDVLPYLSRLDSGEFIRLIHLASGKMAAST